MTEKTQPTEPVIDDNNTRMPANSIMDLCKVTAFLVLAIVAQRALTGEDSSHVEGVSEPRTHVVIPSIVRTPDLVDLSTVGF
mgnify:CR=1 FL=1|jgi:hypothetical protein